MEAEDTLIKKMEELDSISTENINDFNNKVNEIQALHMKAYDGVTNDLNTKFANIDTFIKDALDKEGERYEGVINDLTNSVDSALKELEQSIEDAAKQAEQAQTKMDELAKAAVVKQDGLNKQVTDLKEKVAEMEDLQSKKNVADKAIIDNLTTTLKKVLRDNNNYVEKVKGLNKVFNLDNKKSTIGQSIANIEAKGHNERLEYILQKSQLLKKRHQNIDIIQYKDIMAKIDDSISGDTITPLEEIKKEVNALGSQGGGKRNYMKWRYVNAPILFGGYKRESLNKLAKKWGMENPKFYKKKGDLMKMIHFIMFAKYGDVVKRKHLNVVAEIVGINQKKYKKKVDLLNAIQVKSKNVNFKIRGGKRRTKKN